MHIFMAKNIFLNKLNLRKSIKLVGFFQGMAILFLVLTLAGFAPTFYLRSFTDAPSLPARFHVHGFFTTVWVFLFLVQSFLIATRKITFHRGMGVLGAVIAAGVLLSGLAILYYLAAGYPQNGMDLEQVSATVWGNLVILAAFSTFVSSGIALRSRPKSHKRLMLLATLSMMGQPLVRIGHFDLLRVSDSIIINDAIYGLGGLLLLFAFVVIHDIRTLGRPHFIVVWGIPLQVVFTIITGLFIANSEFGHSLVFLFN
jgi:hypothetical protein